MAKRFRGRSDVDSPEESQNLSIGGVQLRPPPGAPTILRNLEASLIGVLQADVRCACHIGKILYTADTQGTVLAWNVQDATNQIFMSGLAAPVNALVSVNKSAEMWAGLANGNITTMRLESKSFGNQIVHAHDAAVNCIVEGNSCVWSGGDDFLIKKWDLQGLALFAYNYHHGSIRDLLIVRNRPEQTNLNLWGSSNDSIVSVASMQDSHTQHELTSEVRLLGGHAKAVLVLCKVGVDAIWSGCEDGSIRVWSSLAFSFKKQLNFHKGPVVSLVVMGGHVWTGSGDHTVLVWDASICQPLFTLGDHGGYVKAMVRVEYMCWVFASGKNVKVWCAQSVWETSQQEKDRLTSEVLGLKEDLDKFRRQKSPAEDISKKAQDALNAEKLSAQEKQSQLRAQNNELERLRNEQAEKAKELEKLVKLADESKRNLADENKLLNANVNKLKTEIEKAKSDAKTKLQEAEKNLAQARDDIKKSQDFSKDMSKEKKINEDLRNATLDKLKNAEDEKLRLEHELAQLNESVGREKGSADQAVESLKASNDKQLKEMAKRLRDVEDEAEQSQRKSSSQIDKKDDEAQKLKDELIKNAKDLKKALKSLEDEKARAAKDTEDHKGTLESMKKNQQDSLAASEEQSALKIANLEKELRQARTELQLATDEKSQTLASKDSDMAKLKTKARDLRKAVKQAENERSKLQESFNEKERSLDGNQQENSELRKQIDELTSAIQGRESDLDAIKALLSTATSERDEAGRNVDELKTQLENERNKLQESFTEKQTSRDGNERENNELRKQIDELNSAIKGRESDLDAMKALLSTATGERDEAGKTLQELKTELENERNKLQESFKAKQASLDGNEQENNQLRKQIDDLTSTIQARESDLDALKALLSTTTSERDEAGRNVSDVKSHLENLEQELAKATAAAGEQALTLQSAIEEKTRLAEDLSGLRAESTRTAADGQLAPPEPEKARQDDPEDRGKSLEADLELATNHCEKLRNEIALHEKRAASKSKEIDELEQRLRQALRELEQMMEQKEVQHGNAANLAQEIHQLKQDKRLAMEADRLQQSMRVDADIPSSADEVHLLKQKIAELERNLASSAAHIDQIRQEKSVQNSNEVPFAGDLRRRTNDQVLDHVHEVRRLGRPENEPEIVNEDLRCADAELWQTRSAGNRAAFAIDESYQAAMEREHLENEVDMLRYRLAEAAYELEQLLQEKVAMQVELARQSDELDDVKKAKRVLEGIIAQDADGLQQLNEQNCVLEAHLAQAEDGLEPQARAKDRCEAGAMYMADMNNSLRNEVSMLENESAALQTQHADMQEEIARLQALLEEAQDECRLTGETARCDAESADRMIVELQERVAELEDILNNPHLVSVEDALWERVRELEMALLQAHIKDEFLSQEINRMRKRRKANGANGVHKVGKSIQTSERMGAPFLGDAVEFAIKAVQPGFSMEYTNLKVSGSGDQKTLPRTVEVVAETAIPPTPQVMFPPREITINVPPPPRELPALTLPPVITEKERYFPSHGAMRVRRGLGPASPTGEYNI